LTELISSTATTTSGKNASGARRLAKAIGRAEEEAPEHALLFMNLPYFRKSRFFPAVDVAILRSFRPDMLLTLIEEAHVIWRRIQIREERDKTGARLTERCLRLAYRFSATQSPRLSASPTS
jgi:hypothetical protein